MKTGLAYNIANIKPGGNLVVPRNTIYGNLERAVETAEMRTGRLFKIVKRNDDWTVEDVTTIRVSGLRGGISAVGPTSAEVSQKAMTSEQLKAEADYRHAERLGIVCGSAEPTPEQRNEPCNQTLKTPHC